MPIACILVLKTKLLFHNVVDVQEKRVVLPLIQQIKRSLHLQTFCMQEMVQDLKFKRVL